MFRRLRRSRCCTKRVRFVDDDDICSISSLDSLSSLSSLSSCGSTIREYDIKFPKFYYDDLYISISTDEEVEDAISSLKRCGIRAKPKMLRDKVMLGLIREIVDLRIQMVKKKLLLEEIYERC